MQSSNVPCLPGTLPWLRGTISYQAPARARSRSATSGTTWLRVRSGRVSVFAIAAARSSASSNAGSALAAKAFAAAIAVLRAAAACGISSLSSAMALARFRRHVLAGVLLELELLAPGGEAVGPGLDGEHVPAGLGRRELPVPAVVAVEPHRLTPPLGRALRPPQQRGRDHVVAFAKNIGPYVDDFAGDAFDRIAPAIDAGVDVLDAKARPGRVGRGHVPRLSARIGAHVRRGKGSHADTGSSAADLFIF